MPKKCKLVGKLHAWSQILSFDALQDRYRILWVDKTVSSEDRELFDAQNESWTKHWWQSQPHRARPSTAPEPAATTAADCLEILSVTATNASGGTTKFTAKTGLKVQALF
jgi:hypothetical protein